MEKRTWAYKGEVTHSPRLALSIRARQKKVRTGPESASYIMMDLHEPTADHSIVILLYAPVLVILQWYLKAELWSPSCIHIKLLSVFTPLFVHVLQSKSLLLSFRLQIGWFSIPVQLLKIVFYLHCSVGGPLHHYLLPADDRMIGFLLGFSMVLLAECYWKYSSKILFFFPWNLLLFQSLYDLENRGRILLTYFFVGMIQFTDWNIYFGVLACSCLQAS